MKKTFRNAALCLLLSTINCQLSTAHAQGTAFTYQGRLNSGTNPANGTYDFVFTIYGSLTGTTDGFANQTNSATPVSNGLFTVTLDLGLPGIFTGPDRWLEIDVRTNGNGAYTTLTPRQKLTPTPYAITAGNVVSNGLAAGTYGSAVTFNNAANSFTGNGAGLTGVNAGTLSGLSAAGFWQTGGNAGTTAGPNFLGTSDNQPLEIQVNGQRALRIEPTGGAAPNLIGGYYQNSAGSFHAVVIAGGGTSASLNQAAGDYAFIGAGHGAQAGSFSAVVDGAYNMAAGQFSFIGSGLRQTNLADFSFIGSGTNNLIGIGSDLSVISGGTLNVIQGGAIYSAIGGGYQNTIQTDAQYSTIGGGAYNVASGIASFIGGGGIRGFTGSGNTASGTGSVVGGGIRNVSSGQFATIGGGGGFGGGDGNVASGDYSTVSGGVGNQATNTAATVSGGAYNFATGQNAFVAGGSQNTAGGFGSFAAGQKAQALHQGAFVWADSQNVAFASSANDTFNVRAQGGVQFVTSGGGLSIDGQIRLNSTGGFSQSSVGNFSVDALFIPGGRLTVLTNGNIGIGNINPTNKLMVVNARCDGSSWINASDRNLKQGFAGVDAQAVLARVAALPVTTWSYKAQPDQKHLGPVAQDFHAAFGLGQDDTSISTVDESGVALAAIQGLNQKLNDKDLEIQDLKRSVADLKKLVQSLAERK